MDKKKDKDPATVRGKLKLLLFQLAAQSEHPSYELHHLLKEVLDELHEEVKKAIERKPKLQLVGTKSPS